MAANRPSVYDNQFFNAGAPAAGFKLYTYESGTTTPKTTYTDQAGTIPNTNPITLDADGMCELWLGSGEYTLALYTGLIGSGGALVKTWDDVSGATNGADLDALRADLASTASSKGADLIGFKLTATGSAARLVSERLDEMVFLTDFTGADPTGATLSDAAWNSATAMVGTETGGRTVVIPNGTFVLSNVSLAAKKGLRLVGDAGSAYSVVKVTGSITCNNTGNFQCEGMTFVGAGFDIVTRTVVGSPTGGNILFDMVDNCANWDVTRCFFYGFDTVFRPNAGATNGSYIVNITDNYFGWNNTSIIADGILHWSITNNMFSEDRVANVWIKTGGSFHVNNNHVENSANVLSSGYNFRFGNGTDAVVANGSCDDNQGHQWYGVQAQKITQMSISDNKGRICKGARAISLETACTGIQVHDNAFNGYDGSTYMAYGVYVSASLERISIKTNQFFDFDTCIYVSAPAGGPTEIFSNQITGVTNSISVTGAAAEDLVVCGSNIISGGTILSASNTAAWIAGENVYRGASSTITNTDGFAKAGDTKNAVVNNNASAAYTVAKAVKYVAFTGTNVTTLTLNFSAAAATLDGMLVEVYTQAAVSVAVTFASTGATFVGAPATLGAGSVTRFRFNAASNQWLPA